MNPMHCDDAERCVLGSMLRWNGCIGDVLQVVRVEDFRVDAHQAVCRAIVGLYDAGKPADAVTVAERLLAKGGDTIPTTTLLAELWDAAPSAANAEHYARIVREKSILRSLHHAGNEIAASAESPSGPAEELLEAAERSIFAIAEGAVAGNTVTVADAMREAADRLDVRIASGGISVGSVPTGFIDLDDKTGGLQPSELTVLAARPSVGKSALAIQIAAHATLRDNLPVFFASLEMSRIELAERLMCGDGRVDGAKVRTGRVCEDEMRSLLAAQHRLSTAPLFIDDTAGQTMTRIAANARRLKLRHGIKLVVVDYLGLIVAEDKKLPRHEQVAGISRRLKLLSRELKIPVLALHQLNRNVEHRQNDKPRLADLRESGAVEQDSDTVLLLHRDEEHPNVIEVLIAKQRNGPTGVVPLTFVKEITRFENHAVDVAEGPQPIRPFRGNGRHVYEN